MTNSELIAQKDQYDEITKTIKELQAQKEQLQNSINLYLDSPTFDSSQLQRHIIKRFWQGAYSKYKDAGYLCNDMESVGIRFNYESRKLKEIISKEVKSTKKALDIGCGDGRYSRVFAGIFDEVVGVDLSTQQIEKNIKENHNNNITYISGDVFEHKDIKGMEFDFIFFGGIMLYSQESQLDKFFLHIINLLTKNGKAIARESVYNNQNSYYKSLNYVAYYRDVEFYSRGIFEKYYEKSYQNSGYHMRDLTKYLSVYKDKKDDIIKNTFLLDDIVKEYINPQIITNYFFQYTRA
jgi:cyclopropane fatty-acyl-phospholipid synthase-like methyltransferase